MIFPDLLSFGILNATTVDIACGLAVFASLIMLYQAFSPDERINARARSHTRSRDELRAKRLRPSRAPTREKTVAAVHGLLEQLELTRGDGLRKAIDLLARAGWRAREHLIVFQTTRLVMPILFGVATYGLTAIFDHHGSILGSFLFGIAGVVLGAYAPSIFITNASQKRQKQIQLGLPDALDLFVICAEAGLSLDAAVSRVAREIGPASPQLADELGLTAIELGFLPNRRDAFVNLGTRAPLPSIRNLVNTLSQTERYGTPLADSLRVLAAEFRDQRMMKAEEKAARLPATLTVPMMLFVLPPLFVVLLGPAIIKVLATLHK